MGSSSAEHHLPRSTDQGSVQVQMSIVEQGFSHHKSLIHTTNLKLLTIDHKERGPIESHPNCKSQATAPWSLQDRETLAGTSELVEALISAFNYPQQSPPNKGPTLTSPWAASCPVRYPAPQRAQPLQPAATAREGDAVLSFSFDFFSKMLRLTSAALRRSVQCTAGIMRTPLRSVSLAANAGERVVRGIVVEF